MKKILIPVLFLCAGCQWAVAQTAYLEKVEVQRRDVAKEGRRVVVEMDLNISEMDMKKQHSLQLVPTIVSGDRSQEQALDTLVVNGKIRHKAMRRDDALAGRDEDTTRIRRRNRKEQAVHYEASVPFKRWMIEGGLELRGYVTGCAQCDEGDENANTGPILPFTPPVYALSPKETPAEEVKRRAVTKVARLQFRQDADRIVPSFKNNRQELDSVQASIDAVINFVLDDEEVVKRLSGRRLAPSTGRIYHIVTNPPKQEGIDDETGEKLIQRDDDKPEAIRHRLEVYRKETAPLIDYYRGKGNIIDIDASPAPEAVLAAVVEALKG